MISARGIMASLLFILLLVVQTVLAESFPPSLQHRQLLESPPGYQPRAAGLLAPGVSTVSIGPATTTIVNTASSKTAVVVLQPSLVSVLAPLPTSGWISKCVTRILYDYAYTTDPATFGFVGKSGIRSSADIDGDTWGITYARCKTSCGDLKTDFDFNRLANALVSYFLPWLGLCAQLPFENGTWGYSVMALLLPLGSPALAGFSLMLSYFSVMRIRAKFRKFRPATERQAKQIQNIEIVMLQALQEPVALWREQRSISELLIKGGTDEEWQVIADAARRARRGFTASLIAQVAIAAAAFVLTVISSLATSIGDENTQLQISNGGLWLWLIPVVLGWVLLGNQSKAKSIEDIVDKLRPRQTPSGERQPYDDTPSMEGIQLDSIVSAHPGAPRDDFSHRNRGKHLSLYPWRFKCTSWREYFRYKFQGDALWQGGAFNYARFIRFNETIDEIDKVLTERLIHDRTRIERFRYNNSPAEVQADRDANLLMPLQFLNKPDEMTGLLERTCRNPVRLGSRIRIFLACVFGIFVMWGAAGASIVVAYLTQTIGLGCRSGSYVLYAMLGTFVLACHGLSEVFSHRGARKMSDYKECLKRGATHSLIELQRSHERYLTASCVMQLMGRTCAILNACFLIIIAILEPVGQFNNCFCYSTALALRENGWLTLFKTAKDLANDAQQPTAGGVALAFGTVVIAIAFLIALFRNGGLSSDKPLEVLNVSSQDEAARLLGAQGSSITDQTRDTSRARSSLHAQSQHEPSLRGDARSPFDSPDDAQHNPTFRGHPRRRSDARDNSQDGLDIRTSASGESAAHGSVRRQRNSFERYQI